VEAYKKRKDLAMAEKIALMSAMCRSFVLSSTLALILGGSAYALDSSQTQTGGPASGGLVTPMDTGEAASAAATATTTPATANTAPAGTGSISDTLTDLKRFFTVTCDVREEYDDNIYTSNTDKVASLKEEISPSILFSYPMDNSTFDARYTFGFTYYNHSPNNNHVDQDHDIVLRYNHSFSDRFNLDLRDDGGYHVDPALLDNIGTVNREGGYYDNIFTGELTAQWTPLFGTVSSYSNNFIYYENGIVGTLQDSDENTFSQDFRFAFWPTVTFAAGLIYDNIDYFYATRGYTNYTANAGLDWQALPSLSFGFRVGGSIATLDQGGGSQANPYASANVNWQLGERSRFIGSYVHTVTPTDFQGADAETDDRITGNFLYNFTQDITTHFTGDFTRANYSQNELDPSGGAISSFSEDVAAFDTGVTYHYNQYVDFELGYIFSIVDSEQQFRNYTRNQIYIGARGTY
jgi:hypothetical protein